MSKRNWHAKEWHNVAAELGVDTKKGLSFKEVARRLERFGPNALVEKKKTSPLTMMAAQFKDFMIMVLLAATVISGLMGEIADAITILAIVILNAILGFVQEFRAEKSMEALKKLTAPEARVVREGGESKIPAKELVPGDVVLLETGDKIPADLRLTNCVNMEIEEATLTGESVPVKKTAATIPKENLGLGDRKNMAYMGTIITRGRGQGMVIATAMETEMGQIAGMIQAVEEEETPLQRRLEQLGRYLVILCLLICAVVVATGVWRGESPYRMLLAGLSLAVAAIPEGLPAIVTIALAVGVQKMIKRNAIIRKLPAVETLGCATVICSDKTGTLTQNEMMVRKVFVDGEFVEVTGQGYDPKGQFQTKREEEFLQKVPKAHPINQLLKVAALCNNAMLSKKGVAVAGLFRGKGGTSWEIQGDPTEGALLVAAAKGGIWREVSERKEKRVAELPFDSERKRMSVVYEDGIGGRFSYVKGAPDVVLRLCESVVQDGRRVSMNERLRREILTANDKLAGEALRVLALAYRDLPSNATLEPDNTETGLTFLGLAGMIDPPRPSARKAIDVCKRAGIKPVMITGDHRLTAQAVARELGIVDRADEVITGPELDELSDEQLSCRVNDLSVYARVSPKHKLRIVKALKAQGHVVAMTGDGVNDAPAVKEADIGISMGKTGTDVTKEASAMILADDNFATIVAAVEEGRAIYDNIRKFIRYLLSCNLGEVLTMFLASLLALPLPLLPIQILWVNLVTDGLPAMALGVDNAEPDIMQRSPRNPKESVFARGLATKIIIRGTLLGLGSLLVFVLGMLMPGGDLELARTMAFCTLVFSQLFHVLDCKSETRGIFQVGIFSNPYLVGAICISISMQLAAVYLPFMQPIFKTIPLNGLHWGIILIVAGGPSVVIGLYRSLRKVAKHKIAYLKV
ncbi:MAG TPA: calcium-translocating P-type ATPase, SERCA-type [Candidatus Deferrimicrobium sp.]|nr:calcium-translocating P-type ATPase, SERCA-type [Candidatus Deferrimicrobium sp.]